LSTITGKMFCLRRSHMEFIYDFPERFIENHLNNEM